VAAFNIAGVNFGAVIQNMTTGAKYGALLLLALAAYLLGPTHPSPPTVQPVITSAASVGSFGLALISILWVYDGWADVTFVSGEVKRPWRNLPLALVLGTCAVLAIYLLINLAYLHLLNIDEIAGSKLVAADAAYKIIGAPGVKLISLAVMISAFGTLNGSMLTGSRIFFALADDGLFFKSIATIHPRFKTPYVAIILAMALAAAFFLVRNFDQLADTFVLGIWPFYAGGVAAVYTLRRRRPDLERRYKVWGYPITPAIFLASALFLIVNAIVTDTRNIVIFAIIAAGIPVFVIWQRVSASQ